jgi:hypothetical protein
MVYEYNTKNHWVSGLCPLSGILSTSNYRTQRFGNWIYFRLQVRGERHLLCWVPKEELTSVCLNMSCSPHLRTETDAVSETFCFLFRPWSLLSL